jgi:hypothetical protein
MSYGLVVGGGVRPSFLSGGVLASDLEETVPPLGWRHVDFADNTWTFENTVKTAKKGQQFGFFEWDRGLKLDTFTYMNVVVTSPGQLFDANLLPMTPLLLR